MKKVMASLEELRNELCSLVVQAYKAHGGMETFDGPFCEEEIEDDGFYIMPEIKRCKNDLWQAVQRAFECVLLDLGVGSDAYDLLEGTREDDPRFVKWVTQPLVNILQGAIGDWGIEKREFCATLIKAGYTKDSNPLLPYLMQKGYKSKYTAKLVNEITKDIPYKTFWIDMWNVLYSSNGETHGSFFRSCYDSCDPEMWQLGVDVANDLITHFDGLGWDT